jgi:phosphoenolpyruvate synthase/pyruvate phosphate dikinase
MNGRSALRGRGAGGGVYRGIAHVVTRTADFPNVKRGEVVVAHTAAPELVALLDVAGAIVTDLGGVLCHLALVTRELGIPLVVGTGVATTTVRDGDAVTVDGETGLVRRD